MTLSMMTAQALQFMPSQSGLARLNNKAPVPGSSLSPKQMSKIDAASEQFESVFTTEMLKPMFETVKTDSMFGGGQGEETYRGLMLQQYGKQIATTGGLGLAKYVKAEMIKLQEGAKT